MAFVPAKPAASLALVRSQSRRLNCLVILGLACLVQKLSGPGDDTGEQITGRVVRSRAIVNRSRSGLYCSKYSLALPIKVSGLRDSSTLLSCADTSSINWTQISLSRAQGLEPGGGLGIHFVDTRWYLQTRYFYGLRGSI